MFKMRNSSMPFAFECALLFLAIFVFSWGLQGKLVLYQANHGTCSITNSMAKLSTESRGTWTADWIKDPVPPGPALELSHFFLIDFSVQRQYVVSALVRTVSRPRSPGQYYLHGPDLKRRPPPLSA